MHGEEKMDCFEQLYEQYATDVLRICYFYLGDRQRAEDVCQDVFVKLLTTKPNLEQGKEKAWLFKVALNRCRDLWRGAWLKRVTLGDDAFATIPAPDDSEQKEQEKQLVEAIHSLAPDFRDVILLFYYQNFQISEISAILHLPEGTISSRLSRARDKLKRILEKPERGS